MQYKYWLRREQESRSTKEDPWDLKNGSSRYLGKSRTSKWHTMVKTMPLSKKEAYRVALQCHRFIGRRCRPNCHGPGATRKSPHLERSGTVGQRNRVLHPIWRPIRRRTATLAVGRKNAWRIDQAERRKYGLIHQPPQTMVVETQGA